MKKLFTILILLLLISQFIHSQSSETNARNILGREYAENFLNSALQGNEFNIVKNYIIIENQDIAISIAEPILFNLYGKEHIENQKPYEIYRINNYWLIFGTLPSGYLGGVFSIIIDSTNGEIVLIGHGE